MRPNSPPQRTSVSSSRPRAFRSREQAGDRPVDLERVAGDALLEAAVLVPLVAVRDLHEPHAALGEPPRHQALAAEVLAWPRRRGRTAVRVAGGLARDVLDLGRRRLHAEGQLERRDPAFERLVLVRPVPGGRDSSPGSGRARAVATAASVDAFVMNGILAWSDGTPVLPIGVPW